MLKFIFFLFFLFLLLLFLLGFSVLRSFKNFLFGGGNQQVRSHKKRTHPQNNQTRSENRRQKKKIFTQEDGEYVDYEEIK